MGDLIGENPSFMDRVVLGHGDCHGGQIMRRSPVEPGAANLMLIDYDLLAPAPAWHDFGPTIWKHFFTAATSGEKTEYPKKNLKAFAQAYLDELGEIAKGTKVEDVLFDMNKGLVSRLLFISAILGDSGGAEDFRDSEFHSEFIRFGGFVSAEFASKILKEAMQETEAGAALKQEIIDKGIIEVMLPRMAKALGAEGDVCIRDILVKNCHLITALPPAPICRRPEMKCQRLPMKRQRTGHA